MNLADVVKKRSELDRPALVVGDANRITDDERVLGDAADVRAGLGIVGIDRAKQRLERGGGEAFGALAVAAFANERGADRRPGDDPGDEMKGAEHRRE